MSEPLDGTTTRIEVLRNGAPAIVGIDSDSFSDEANLEVRTRTVLGSARAKRNTVVRGYRGTLSFQDTDPQFSAFEAAYLAAVDASAPNDVTIVKTETYADTGLTRTTQYVGVTVMGFTASSSGTANSTRQITWEATDRVIR